MWKYRVVIVNEYGYDEDCEDDNGVSAFDDLGDARELANHIIDNGTSKVVCIERFRIVEESMMVETIEATA
jgi:hypothetical protein